MNENNPSGVRADQEVLRSRGRSVGLEWEPFFLVGGRLEEPAAAAVVVKWSMMKFELGICGGLTNGPRIDPLS